MAMYRADPKDGVAWITGGSTGLGRALALELAREGYTVVVTALDQAETDAVAVKAEGMAGRIVALACDVTDQAGMTQLVARIETEVGPIVLAIFNAGVYQPTHGEDLDAGIFRTTFEVNVFGVLNGLIPTVYRMQERGRGHIVIMGSATSFLGFPAAGAYGASKAALNNMAESLRYDYEKMNIRIQMMNPGFVYTPLTARHEFKMPALMTIRDAVPKMLAGIKSGGFETTFPRKFTSGLKVVRILPKEIVFWLMNRRSHWYKRPLKPRAPDNL